MPETKMKEIADAADMVVNGYAYTCKKHYQKMYLKWSEMSDTGFYEG